MIHITIDGFPLEVAENTTILEAARSLNIHIPTLCYHPDQNVKANCRICVVEVEGARLLAPACATPVTEGMVIKTNSAKVRQARRDVLELILSRHNQDCLHCDRSGICELQAVAEELHVNKGFRFPLDVRHGEKDLLRLFGILPNVSFAAVVNTFAAKSRRFMLWQKKNVDLKLCIVRLLEEIWLIRSA